ncbi:hypothetical protein Tco_0273817 [Tanacetum coccineum]
MVKHEPHFILELVGNGFGSLAMRACVYLRSRRVFNPKGLIKRRKGRRNKAFLHMLCVLDGFMNILFKSVKLVEFLVYLVSSHGWLGLCTQPTPREVYRPPYWPPQPSQNRRLSLYRQSSWCHECVHSCYRVCSSQWTYRRAARASECKCGRAVAVVLGLVMKVVLVMLRGWEAFVRWFWMGELSLEEISMKSVRGIFFGGFWVEELALEAIG